MEGEAIETSFAITYNDFVFIDVLHLRIKFSKGIYN